VWVVGGGDLGPASGHPRPDQDDVGLVGQLADITVHQRTAVGFGTRARAQRDVEASVLEAPELGHVQCRARIFDEQPSAPAVRRIGEHALVHDILLCQIGRHRVRSSHPGQAYRLTSMR
jgi:hypothetical protein